MSDAKDYKSPVVAVPAVPFDAMEQTYVNGLQDDPIDALVLLLQQTGDGKSAAISSVLAKFEAECAKLPDHVSPESLLVTATDAVRAIVGTAGTAVQTLNAEQRAQAMSCIIHSAYRFPGPGAGVDAHAGSVYEKAARVGVNVVAPILLCARSKTRVACRFQLDRGYMHDSRATREVRSRIRMSPDGKAFQSDIAHFLDVHTSNADPLPTDDVMLSAEQLILEHANDGLDDGASGVPYHLMPDGKSRWTEVGLRRACVFLRQVHTDRRSKKNGKLDALFADAVRELCSPSTDGKWTDVKSKPTSAAGRSIQSAAAAAASSAAASEAPSPLTVRVSRRTMALLEFVRHSHVLGWERASRPKSTVEMSFDAARHLEFSGNGSIDLIAQMVSPDNSDTWAYTDVHKQMERDAGVMAGVVDETANPSPGAREATPRWTGVVWNATLLNGARRHLNGISRYLSGWADHASGKSEHAPKKEFELWLAPSHGHRKGMPINPFGNRPAAVQKKWMQLMEKMHTTLDELMGADDNLVFKVEVEAKCPALNSFLGLFPCDSYFSNPLLANVHAWSTDGKIKMNNGVAKGQAVRRLSHMMASRLLRHAAAVEMLYAFPKLKGMEPFDRMFHDQFLSSATDDHADFENQVRLGVFSYRSPTTDFRLVAARFRMLHMRNVWHYAVKDMSLMLFTASVCHRATNYTGMLMCQSYVDTLANALVRVDAKSEAAPNELFAKQLAHCSAMVIDAARVALDRARFATASSTSSESMKFTSVKDYLRTYVEQFRTTPVDRKSRTAAAAVVVASAKPAVATELAWLLLRPFLNALIDIAARWCELKYASHDLVTQPGIEWAIRLFTGVTQRLQTVMEQELRKRWSATVARMGKTVIDHELTTQEVRRARNLAARGNHRAATAIFQSALGWKDHSLVQQLLLDATRNCWTAGIASEVGHEAETVHAITEMSNTTQNATVAALCVRSVLFNF